MSEINSELIQRIKSLPPLPESVVHIQEICANPNSGIADLSAIVSKDPMLTANLLKAANSPLYGFSREIKTINQAVSLFGMATVKGFALASAVKDTIKIDMSPYGRNANDFSDIAQKQSALMLNWYGKINREMMNILAPASFLDGVGEIIIAAAIINQGKIEAFRADIEACDVIEEVEQKYFNVTSQQVAAEVFTKWRLEALMVRAIAISHDPAHAEDEIKPYAYALKVVRNAINLKEGFTGKAIAAAVQTVKESGLDEAAFLKAVEVVAQ
jgi:HD-like signal output (HDOD) protein